MSRNPSRACSNCAALLVDPQLLSHVKSEAGYEYTVGVEDFHRSVQRGCTFCTVYRDSLAALDKPIDLDSPQGVPSGESLPLDVDMDLVRKVKYVLLHEPDVEAFQISGQFGSCPRTASNYYIVMADRAKFINTRPMNPETGSVETLTKAKGWISRCLNSHTLCRKPSHSLLPSRLIDVGCGDDMIRVASSRSMAGPYAALSYCWGGPQQVQLTRETVATLETQLSLHSLPATIRDAVAVAQSLGLQYLWVDALCIIQDSPEDKMKEISRMEDYYQNSYVTICAASSPAAYSGMLQPRQKPVYNTFYNDFSITMRCPDGVLAPIILTSNPDHGYSADMEPLNHRAWALQESLLSTRRLIFGKWQVSFECQSGTEADGGYPARWTDVVRLDRGLGYFPLSDKAAVDATAVEKYYELWDYAVADYSRRGLSVSADKLPGISGVARLVQRVTGDEYVAGLWASKLKTDLTWKITHAEKRRPAEWRAPTWSWVAVNGRAKWFRARERYHSLVAEATELSKYMVTAKSAGTPFGELQSGEIILQGHAMEFGWNGCQKMRFGKCTPPIVFQMHPDVDGEFVAFTDTSVGDQRPFRLSTNSESNEKLMMITSVPLTGRDALMLRRHADGNYSRVGVMGCLKHPSIEYGATMDEMFASCPSKMLRIL